MLVLSRKVDEAIVINGNIKITVIEVRGNKVRLGVEAPGSVPVHREEIHEAIQRQKAAEVEVHKERAPIPAAAAKFTTPADTGL